MFRSFDPFLPPFLRRLAQRHIRCAIGSDGVDDGTGAPGGGAPEPKLGADGKPLPEEPKLGADGKPIKPDSVDPLTTDITKAIERARSQERNKLHSTIEDVKKAEKTARELAESRAAENASLKEKIAALEGKKPPGETPNDDGKKPAAFSEEMIDKLIASAIDKASEVFEPQLQAAQARIKELEEANKTVSLTQVREQLISENKDHIIPELVMGNTKEELETSLVVAKQAFARLSSRLKPAPGTPGAEETPPAGGTPRTITVPTPPVAGNTAPGTTVTIDTRTMSNKDFAANRVELLKAASAEAKKSLVG